MIIAKDVVVSIPLIKETLNQITSSGMFWLLIILIVVDVILGKYYAILTGNYTSSIGTQGMIKHSTILLITITISLIFRMVNQVGFVYTFAGFYILEYITSIVENLTLLGVKLPSAIVDRLGMTKETYNEKVERSLRENDDV